MGTAAAPPNANPAVCNPAVECLFLALLKSPLSVHAVPLYSSVLTCETTPDPGLIFPPHTQPAVCVPSPSKTYLPVPKLPPAVQFVPSYSRVATPAGGPENPPAEITAV